MYYSNLKTIARKYTKIKIHKIQLRQIEKHYVKAIHYSCRTIVH